MYKKGQSGNPAGRPVGSISLKEYARRKLASMNDEEREEFFEGIDKRVIWEMSEGKPKQDVEASITHNIAGVLDSLEHGNTAEAGQETPVEGVENPASIQNQEQATAVSEVQAEPSAGTLQAEQVVSEPNPEIPPVGVHNG